MSDNKTEVPCFEHLSDFVVNNMGYVRMEISNICILVAIQKM